MMGSSHVYELGAAAATAAAAGTATKKVSELTHGESLNFA